ncbi:MAG TPA: TIGR03435 family protein [Vicinamibacterales bacterium]|nr:TIGR03435 family protein [Vicinamibacterales bacterium]
MKHIVLATVWVLALAFPIVTGAIDAAAVPAAQLPGAPAAGPPVDLESRFEVVSIKRFDPSGGAQPRMSMTPGRYDVAGITARVLIMQAFLSVQGRIFGMPDWVDTERYTIAAKAADSGPAASRAIFVMVANMLKDRFKMVTHKETRELPVYNLVFARTDKRFGPAFKESSAECRAKIAARLERGDPQPAPPTDGVAACESLRITPGIAAFSGVPMAAVAGALTPLVGRPVIDKTGLTGSYYAFTLRWTPDLGGGIPGLQPGVPGTPQPPPDPDAPNLFTAVQEQLGLKLENARGPAEVVVIDHIEKPELD